MTGVNEDHHHHCRWHCWALACPCPPTVWALCSTEYSLKADLLLLEGWPIHTWNISTQWHRALREQTSEMDFLVALQLVEQFTLVKNVKYYKVRETACPLYLVINRDYKVRWLIQNGHILFITENQGVCGTNCLGKASRTGSNKPFTQKQYFQAFPSVTMSKIVHWRQTFLLASSAFCDLCPPQSWIDSK